MFKLPAYQELSKEQDTINNLPLDGRHLIVGPPGTGKTVIAIYRAEMCKKKSMSSQFIVFNHTLRQYLNTAVSEKKVESQTTTYHSWFYSWYARNFHDNVPQISDYNPDWQAIHKNISKKTGYEKFDHLIIDEGQDLDKYFYLVLPQVANNITVFADENQRLHDTNSTIDDIKMFLGVNGTHNLTRNYRNSLPIAKIARCFYAGLPSGIPELPERKGSLPRLILGRDFYSQMDLIAQAANNYPDYSTGVFFKTQKEQKEALRALKARVKDSVNVQAYMYNHKNHKNINFNKNGVFILTYKSAKGLEFDTVFIPNLQKLRTDANVIDEKMTLYVLTSRARNFLYLLTSNDDIPGLMRSVPEDLYRIHGKKSG